MSKIVHYTPTNKGITLIALIITIIVLLVLSGVTISILTGENELGSKARQAKLTSEISQEKEAIKLVFEEIKMNKLIDEEEAIVASYELEYLLGERVHQEISAEDYDNNSIKVLYEESQRTIYSDSKW